MGNDYYNCSVCNHILSSYGGGYIHCAVCCDITCCYSTHKRNKKFKYNDDEDEKTVDICNNCIDAYEKKIAYLKMTNKKQKIYDEKEKREKELVGILSEFKKKQEQNYEDFKKKLQEYFEH